MSYKFYDVTIMTSLDAVDANGISFGGVAGATTVKIMHWKTGVR